MPGGQAVIGSSYYGRIDGELTKAVLVSSNESAQDGTRFYILAVPANENDQRAQQVRDAQTGAPLWSKLVALALLGGVKRNPRLNQTYADWGEAHPRLDDLQALLRVPAALPFALAPGTTAAHVVLSEAEAEGDSEAAADTEHELGPEVLNLFTRIDTEQTEVPAREGPPALLTALNHIAERLSALESARGSTGPTGVQPGARPATQPGAFDDLDAELDRAARGAPLQARAEPVRAPPPPCPTDHAREGQLPVEMAEWMRAMTAAITAPATREPSSGISAAHAGLFKLHGAKGRVAQDELDRQFDASPGQVVEAFEDAVKRRAGGLTTYANIGGRDGDGRVSDVLLQVWRETVPARESATIARVGEAVIDAYRQIRRGDPMRGAARLALLIGAMEQATLDNNRWQLRASTMLGMPTVPLHAYHALTPDAKKGQDSGKQLGEMARLADPMRATTALAVHKDSQPQA